MSTSKPISTISFNSESFLREKLEDLYSRKMVSFWFYIRHDAEEDEKKDHFHVYLQPNRLIDLMDLQFEFRETNLENLNKPFGCMPFRYSDIDNAIPYYEHNPYYLSMVKHESRQYIYKREDFVVSDEDFFDHLYRHSFHASDWAKDDALIKLLRESDLSPHEIIERGYVPKNMWTQLNAYYYMKEHYGKLDRNGREGHGDEV